MGKTVKMSFEGKSQQEIGKWTDIAYTPLIVLDPEIPFTLPEMKGISGTDGAHNRVIK